MLQRRPWPTHPCATGERVGAALLGILPAARAGRWSDLTASKLEVIWVERPLSADEPSVRATQDVGYHPFGQHRRRLPDPRSQVGVLAGELGPEPCLPEPDLAREDSSSGPGVVSIGVSCCEWGFCYPCPEQCRWPPAHLMKTTASSLATRAVRPSSVNTTLRGVPPTRRVFTGARDARSSIRTSPTSARSR